MAAAAKAKESPPVQILRLRIFRIKPAKGRKRKKEAAAAVVDVRHLRWKID